MLYRQLGDVLILRSAQDQDRNLGRGEKEPIEGLDSAAVGQEEVDQYRRDPPPPRSHAFCIAAESRQAFGASPNPFDLELTANRIGQRIPHHMGIRGIVLNE